MDNSSLSKQQKSVINAFEEGRNIFVTGGAGSGKSYLLNFLKINYAGFGLEVCASTGIAAVNVGGSTIHSWAGIGLANMPVEKIVSDIFSPKFSRVRRRIKQTRALAIDEISMISADVLDLLDQVLREVREVDKPMGGMQMLFFGDFLQLPPIANHNQNFDFCFNSNVWKELGLELFELEEIFRQSDKKFVSLLNNLRFGELDEGDIANLNSRVGIKDENSAIKPTILTTHNYKVEKINETQLKKIPREEVVHGAEYYGDKFKKEFLKKNCIASQALKLKVGAQVMMVKNTYQKDGIINGSLGVVRDFSTKKKYPLVEFSNGKIIKIAPEEWRIEKFNKDTGEVIVEAGVMQIPLILAWAMTIHKSQGLTLDKIFCDLSDVFSPGQAYVALSRARSLDGVFIESINFDKIFSDRSATEFYKSVR